MLGYLPVFYQAFAGRETHISMMDAWAGSPPTAGALLTRLASDGAMSALDPYLREWEAWSAEFLEHHLSYPVLAYFRSQHGNQSWLAALTAILDTCALVRAGLEGVTTRGAWLTFAMARHAVVDLCQVFQTPPLLREADRLSPTDAERLWTMLRGAGLHPRDGAEAQRAFADLRRMYDPTGGRRAGKSRR